MSKEPGQAQIAGDGGDSSAYAQFTHFAQFFRVPSRDFKRAHDSFISKKGLSLYFTSATCGSDPSPPGCRPGFGGWDIFVCQRATVNDPWGPAQNLGPAINTPYNEGAPSLSVDGHRMYFASNRPGGFGGNDLYVSRRHDKRDDFGWQPPE
jgi:hypothetical protein